MEEFIETISNPGIANQLWQAIRGRGAFRVFKDTLYRLNLLSALSIPLRPGRRLR